MYNIYDNPEKFELEQVAIIDYSDGCYCFDYRVVWRDKTGQLYTARDSGCSCPSPFEEYHSVKDLETFSLSEVLDETFNESKKEYYCGDNISEFRDAIKKLQK